MTYTLGRCPECDDTGYATDPHTGAIDLCYCTAGQLAQIGLSLLPYDLTDEDNDRKDDT